MVNCISELKAERDYDEIIYMTPDAPTLNQKTANTLSLNENMIILCGHYKGVDQRVRELFITKEMCEANQARLEWLSSENLEEDTGCCFRILFVHPDRQQLD